ncbi:hypothetical protein ACFVV7_37105 [Streptomyces globisporus]|uniref:hypothetical protein n=1 Tax=Streptomyces globisporus TaxID=1908 RepID=UPI0036DB0A4C
MYADEGRDAVPGEGQESLFDLAVSAEPLIVENGRQYEAEVVYLGTPDDASVGGWEKTGDLRWQWLQSLRWPQAPGGGAHVTLCAAGDPASALWDAVLTIEDAGVRVIAVPWVSRLDDAGVREEDIESRLRAQLAARPGQPALEELQEAKLRWLERAGIAREDPERSAQLRTWWERHPSGDDGSGQLRELAAAYGRCAPRP